MAEHYILFEVGQPPEIRRNMQVSISKEISRTEFRKIMKIGTWFDNQLFFHFLSNWICIV